MFKSKNASAVCAVPIPSRYASEGRLQTVQVIHRGTKLTTQELIRVLLGATRAAALIILHANSRRYEQILNLARA